jgi:PhnB protein
MKGRIIKMEKQKIEIIPYLSFKGNCEEALNAYINAFGGEIHYMSRWSENTADVSKQIGKVMHVEFSLGNTHMAASDSFDGAEVNTDIKLMIHMNSHEEALQSLAVLAEGGTIPPLLPNPEPDDDSCCVILKDRYGYMWIITCPNSAKQ